MAEASEERVRLLAHISVLLSVCLFVFVLFVCCRFLYWAGFPVIPHMYLACFTHGLGKKRKKEKETICALTFLDTLPT